MLELASGVAGPYAGRLLAMLGATVLKREPSAGDPARTQPVDDEPVSAPSPLYLHLNAGKRNVSGAALALDEAIAWADLVLDDRVQRQCRESPLDPDRLRQLADPPLLVSLTAWGFAADDPGSTRDEMLVQAAAGVMTLTGDRDGPPLRFPGWQSQALAGAYAAAGALEWLHAREFRHLDVSWLACMASGVEASFADYMQKQRSARPGGAHPAHLYPSGALPCADGHVVPGTVRIRDWQLQCRLYGREDLLEDPRFHRRRTRAAHVPELWAEIEPWYAAHSAREIFEAALGCQWAVGMVMKGTDVLSDPHIRERGFLGEIASSSGPYRAAVAPWRTSGLPVRDQALREAGEDDAWWHAQAARRRPGSTLELAGLRVLELTVAWAGPFVGRYLGALGADVVKVESTGNVDGWRGPHRFAEALPSRQGGDPEELSYDIACQFNSLNRNKRHVVIDLKSEAGRGVFIDLVRGADVVVANFTERVLPALRLQFEVLRAVNPRIVLLNMPALGASGPYKGAAGYGTIIEGMGGFAARFGGPDERARISQTFYPDPVAGLHGVVAVLSALKARQQTGHGSLIDLSQQEALWMLLGEGIVLASRSGRDIGRTANREPGAAASGIVQAADDAWVAVVGDADLAELLERSREHAAADLVALVRARGGRAELVQDYSRAAADPRLGGAFEVVDHPVTGRVQSLRVPGRVDGRPRETRRPAPRFDEHTDAVLQEWGKLDALGVAALRSSGAVGGRPGG